ncbi:MAG: type II and III secretion system protein family protein [Hellea sp.]|nr:type II and III secretion system protein family protein [Hellea sp.]
MTKIKKLLLSTLIFGTIAAPAQAKSWIDDMSGTRSATSVTIDDLIVMRTEESFKEVRVANADIADVLVLTDRSFQVMGKKGGKTNVLLYDQDKQIIDIISVTVGYDLAELKKTLFETMPGQNIEVRPMGSGVYLSGEVSSQGAAVQAEKIAQAYAPGRVTSAISVNDSHQVMLEVRFVEASRTAIKELGIGILTGSSAGDGFQLGGGLLTGSAPTLAGTLLSSSGNFSLDTNIQALEEQGVIRTLAEPNLVSMSGDTASFLAGGEFPIPVSADDGQIGIEFRQFGVGLSFTPTVLDDGIINLEVKPEVSQIDTTNSVRIAGTEIPSLRVRRADTTVELRNGQSFAIAGLLQNDKTTTKSQVPWLGDVPVLGSLFRSSRYKNQETELVIIVTPRLVKPAPDISDLATPHDFTKPPSELDLFLGGELEKTSDAGGLAGNYGHTLQ